MGEGGPSAGRLGGLVQGQIDQFVNGLSPADIVGASDPAAAAASLNSARSAWQTYSKASDLDNAVQAARDKADKALVPYAAVDQSTRNAVAQLRNSRANWTPDELAALERSGGGLAHSAGFTYGWNALADESDRRGDTSRRRSSGRLCDRWSFSAGARRRYGDGIRGQGRGE
jgi:hypothetical protein